MSRRGTVPRAQRFAAARMLLPLILLALLSCKDVPTGPDIRTVEFVEWLEIDLATFTEMPSGVFVKDVQTGAGAPAANGSTVDFTVEGWLPDGLTVQPPLTRTNLRVGSGAVIAGLDHALVGMRAGGERKAIVPPHLAHGRQQVMVFLIQMSAVR